MKIETLEKILNEPKELKYSRELLRYDLHAMMFILAGNLIGELTVERLETLSLQLKELLNDTETLRQLMIKYDNETENKDDERIPD